MKYEKEITVEVNMSFEELKQHLSNMNFEIKEEYSVNDIYMLKKDSKVNNDYLEWLKNCVLLRHIIKGEKNRKIITYKYKEYNDNKEIIKQGKTDCVINSIDEAKELFEALKYEELIKINDNIFVYSNGVDELSVQYVNNKHVYIEIEDECHYIDKFYETIEDMKQVIKKYDIHIKQENYFVKKAEIEIMETRK